MITSIHLRCHWQLGLLFIMISNLCSYFKVLVRTSYSYIRVYYILTQFHLQKILSNKETGGGGNKGQEKPKFAAKKSSLHHHLMKRMGYKLDR